MSHSHHIGIAQPRVVPAMSSRHTYTDPLHPAPILTLILKQPHVPHVIINTHWFPIWVRRSSHVCLLGQRLRESCLCCLHTVLNQCVAIQAIASIFSPALFPIWCSIGGIILQLSSQGVAVSGDVSVSTGQWTVEAALHLYCEYLQSF